MSDQRMREAARHAPGSLEELAGSAALAGEAPVRSAIQSALISWALGSHGPAQKFNQP